MGLTLSGVLAQKQVSEDCLSSNPEGIVSAEKWEGEEGEAIIYCSAMLKQNQLQLLQSWQIDVKGFWNLTWVKIF